MIPKFLHLAKFTNIWIPQGLINISEARFKIGIYFKLTLLWRNVYYNEVKCCGILVPLQNSDIKNSKTKTRSKQIF